MCLGWFGFATSALPLGSSGFSGVDKNQYPHPVQPFSLISLVRDGYFVPPLGSSSASLVIRQSAD